MADFEHVGKVGDFSEGKVHARNVNGANVGIVCLDGKLHALSNVCPHANYDLSDSPVADGKIFCNWHFSAFDVVTGAVSDGPSGKGLEVYDVQVRGDDVLVGKD